MPFFVRNASRSKLTSRRGAAGCPQSCSVLSRRFCLAAAAALSVHMCTGEQRALTPEAHHHCSTRECRSCGASETCPFGPSRVPRWPPCAVVSARTVALAEPPSARSTARRAICICCCCYCCICTVGSMCAVLRYVQHSKPSTFYRTSTELLYNRHA